MSGRPANPSYTVRTWATDANYAAGAQPWSSQPIKVEPPSPAGGFVPGQGAGAPYVNRLFNDAFTQDANAKTYQSTLLEYVGQMQALNWPLRVGLTVASSTTKSALYNKTSRTWWTFGTNHGRANSTDAGHSWGTASSSPSDGYISGDANGVVMVIGKASRYAHRWDGATWSDVDVYGAAFTNAARVVYDPVNAKFVWVAVSGGGGSGLAYTSNSTDGTGGTWSAPSSITGTWLSNADARFGLAVDKTAGRVVFAGIESGNFRFAYSSNGGSSWTVGAGVATAIPSPTEMHLSWNEEEGAFYFVIGETSGTHSCEVWRSADGSSWTKQATLTGWSLKEIAGLGALLVAVAAGGDVMYSIDQGVTWRIAHIAVSGTPVGVYVGGGRPVIVTSSHVYVGLSAGLPWGVF